MSGPAARTLRPQDEISHYTIVGPLGAGGMGEVYLAQDQSLERRVALKILPPDLVRSEERVRRFVLEARSASSLSHPNIVTIYEIGRDAVRTPGEADSEPLHFISMELVSGKTLAALIHEEKTDLKTLLGYLAQAADGLAKAHGAGIVHRDLKPGNIMVSADGFTKVLDFGLAKLTEASDPAGELSTAPTMMADATREGIIVGTAGYMSPEQVQGKSVDHRSDIFSFGCILYEAATRRRPFIADTGVETMHKILHDKPTPVEELNSRAPAELRRLIRRCLQKSPDQRLQSMKDLALELREIADEYDALSASASSGTVASGQAVTPRPRGIPAAAWIGGAVIVAAVIALAVWRLAPRPPAAQPFQTMRVTLATSRGDVREAALSPDGRYLAYLAGAPGQITLRVRQVATGSDVEILPPSDATAAAPSFSPDGNYLYYTAPRPDRRNYRALFQVPSLGGKPRERAFDVDSRVSFSPDGKQFAFWRRLADPEESHLLVTDAESGQERILARIPDQERFSGSPSWSPDGRRIAGLLQNQGPGDRCVVALFDAASGKRQDLSDQEQTFLNSLAWIHDGSALVVTGQNLANAITNQVWLYSYPGGRVSRVTNDVLFYSGASASMADGAIAVVRNSQVANLWVAGVSGGPARRLTAITNPESSPFNIGVADSATILYSTQDGDNLQLRTLPAAGGESQPLTTGASHSFRGEGAAGVLVFDRADSLGIHVWRMNTDGTGERRLTSGAGGQHGHLSRDGRYVTVGLRDDALDFAVLSTSDGRAVLSPEGYSGVLGFSPDGRSILAGRAEKDEQGLTITVYVPLPLEGGAPGPAVRIPGSGQAVGWHPDGRSLSYRDLADPAWNVYRQPFDGGPRSPVTRFTEGRVTGYLWSPDGRSLAVRLQKDGTTNIWVTGPDGGDPVPVTTFTSEEIFEMAWLTDSRRLVVNAGTDASDAVLIRDFR